MMMQRRRSGDEEVLCHKSRPNLIVVLEAQTEEITCDW